jgi:hypothetical protein
MDWMVPVFWGVVKVSDFGGVPDHDGIERDNAMQGMLSRNLAGHAEPATTTMGKPR